MVGGCQSGDGAAAEPPIEASVTLLPPPATRASEAQPREDRVIDGAAFHAADLFEQIKDAGLVAAGGSDDQAWLGRRVDETAAIVAEYFRKLKATRETPLEYYGGMALTASESAPAGLITRLGEERKGVAAWIEPSFARAGLLLPVAVMDPDLLSDWLAAANVPPAVATRVKRFAAAEVARVAAASVGLTTRTDAAALAAARQRVESRRRLWTGIARWLTVEQRRAFAAAIDGNASGKQRTTRDYVLFVNRNEHGWTSNVPPDAVADSDRANAFTAPAGRAYSLHTVDGRKVVATVNVARGSEVGFAFDGMFGTAMAAFAGDTSVPVSAAEHLYYWAPAAPGARPFVPTDATRIRPTTAP